MSVCYLTRQYPQYKYVCLMFLRYCHGYVVERSKIQPYNEPDHSSLAPGVMCLARDASDSLWKRAIVTDLAEDKVTHTLSANGE